jgi:hypothetical protein
METYNGQKATGIPEGNPLKIPRKAVRKFNKTYSELS